MESQPIHESQKDESGEKLSKWKKFCKLMSAKSPPSYVPYIDSVIVKTDDKKRELVKLCRLEDRRFVLIYRASMHGFASAKFHEMCKDKRHTLTIIKTTRGCVFGGYANVTWDTPPDDDSFGYKNDPDAFIFSLVNTLKRPMLMPIKNTPHAICTDPKYGPTFGFQPSDIFVTDRSHLNYYSKVNPGHSYELKDFASDLIIRDTFMTDSANHFQASEIEVFQLSRV